MQKGIPPWSISLSFRKKRRKSANDLRKKSDLYEIKAKAEEYARFQHGLARLAKINFKIRSLLEKIRDQNCQDVDEYRRMMVKKA